MPNSSKTDFREKSSRLSNSYDPRSSLSQPAVKLPSLNHQQKNPSAAAHR
ncbi:hypothetical protein [Planctopirus hydrillae]|nr:hypothetical protein [Planctopirus hydrillae]